MDNLHICEMQRRKALEHNSNVAHITPCDILLNEPLQTFICIAENELL